MLKVHEFTGPLGELVSVFLRFEGGELALVSSGDGVLMLPPLALEAVMTRFGAPLEPTEPLVAVATLDLGDGCVLRHARHLARYDVIARDYLVYVAPAREPLCALATTIAAALGHLGRAAKSLETAR